MRTWSPLDMSLVDKEKEELLKVIQTNREKWVRAEQEKSELAQQVKDLKEQNRHLMTDNVTLPGQQLIQLEQRPSTSAGHPVLFARPAGTKTKPRTLVQVTVPHVASASATPKTLQARARELMKVKTVL